MGNQISDSINKLLICMSLNPILLFCVLFSLNLPFAVVMFRIPLRKLRGMYENMSVNRKRIQIPAANTICFAKIQSKKYLWHNENWVLCVCVFFALDELFTLMN